MTGGVRWPIFLAGVKEGVGEDERGGPSQETFGRQRRQEVARVVRKVDNAIHWINHYLADSAVCFVNTYPLEGGLSGGSEFQTRRAAEISQDKYYYLIRKNN